MSSYPTTPAFQTPVIEEMHFKTLTSKVDDLGTEQRKQKWLYPRRVITLNYNAISTANARTLWQFYQARAGAYGAFNWFHTRSDSYVTEYVGTGDGTTTNFNLPSKSASSRTLYLDSTSQTETTDWVFTGSGGADGADLCAFVTAPLSGQRITFTFTGYLKIHCRFAVDQASFETFTGSLQRTGLKLQGLLNA